MNTTPTTNILGNAITATLGKTSVTVSRDIEHSKLQDRIESLRSTPVVRLGWTKDDCEIVDRPLTVRQEEVCLLSILLAIGGTDRPAQWVEWCNEVINDVAKEGGDVSGLSEMVDRAQTLAALRVVHESINQIRAKARRERLAVIVSATVPGMAIGDSDGLATHGAFGAHL